MKWRSLKESRFLAAEFYRGGGVNPELNMIRFRGRSAYKRRILESDGVNMCPGLGWCVFVDLPRDSIKLCLIWARGVAFAVEMA